MMSVKTTENVLVIAGFFREAVLTRCPVKIQENYVTQVLNVIEGNRRSSSDRRIVTLAPLLLYDDSSVKVLNLELQFSSVVVKCKVDLLEHTTEHLAVVMPSSADIVNLRHSMRIEVCQDDSMSTTAVILSDNLHEEATFRLRNISRFGLAGTIELRSNLKIAAGSLITGVIHSPNGKIDISGQIIAQYPRAFKGDLQSIFIRIIRRPAPDIPQENDHGERRKRARYNAKFQLSFRSLLNTSQFIDFDIDDVGILGFSGICTTPLMQRYLIPGVPLILENSSLIADVVDEHEGRIRCQWVSGSEDDRSKWLKKISTAIAPNVALSTPDASELLEIFCSSGAFSGEFLRDQRHNFRKTTNSIQNENNESAYLHRWIDRRGSRETVGHISCIRMGDNAWFATDLVKSAGDNISLSEGFVPKFLHSFAYYAQSLAPVPRMFLIWVKNHPFWASLQKELEVHSPPESFAVGIGYFRLQRLQQFNTRKTDVNVHEIFGFDYQAIDKFLSLLRDPGVIALARAFDFDIDRFASNQLSKSIQQNKGVFWRKYLRVETPHVSGLVVLTALPEGMNPNRIIDSAWFFEDFDSPVKNEHEWFYVALKIKQIAAAAGLSLAGIRRVSSSAHFQKLPLEHAEMTGYLVHPSLVLKFK